jgi:MarR family transcriptional regulator, organic hydroperoxide resistance regulator
VPDVVAKEAVAATVGGEADATETAARQEAVTEVGVAFRRAFRSLRSLRGRDTHRGDELGHAQFELLGELFLHGPMHAGELAEAVAASAATVSGMLDHLCASDLVERTRSETDRRIVVVKLTRRGRRKVEARKALWQHRWQEALEGLDDEELRVAARVLGRISGIFREEQRET